MTARKPPPAKRLDYWPVLIVVRDDVRKALAYTALEQNHFRWPDRNMPRVEIITAMPEDQPAVAYKDWRDVPQWIRQVFGVDIQEVLGV